VGRFLSPQISWNRSGFANSLQRLRRVPNNQNVIGWVLMVGVLVIAAASILWMQRGLTFIWDELPWVENAGLKGVDDFFQPYGGHLIAFPYFVYRLVLELFGIDYTAFGVVQVVGLSAGGTMVYVYAKRRLGPILALAPATVILFLGSSWQVLLQPLVGIQFLCAVVPGLGAILVLESNDRRGDVAACALLAVAAFGFDQVLAFLVGAIVAICLSPNWRQRIWVVAIPLTLYATWHLWATTVEPTGVHLDNIPLLPIYFVDALAAVSNALVGLTQVIAPGPWTLLRLERSDIGVISEAVVFTVLEILVVCGAVWLIRRRGPVPRTFWPALAMLVALFAEMGLIFAPGRTAFENRYLYTGALIFLLVLVEVFKGVRTTRASVAVALALTFAATFGNVAQFHQGRQTLDLYQKEAGAQMAVIQLAGRNGDQSFSPNVDSPEFSPGALWMETGPWREVVERYGSVANSIPELRGQPETIRARADAVAAKALGLQLKVAEGTPTGGCRRVAADGGEPVSFDLPHGGAVIEPTRTTEVALGRWGDEYPAAAGSVEGGVPALLRIPGDPAANVPWRAQLAQGGAATVCAIRPGSHA
jgi:hypothetical protein